MFDLLLGRHGITDSFLFERRTSAVVIMGKLPSVMLVRIRVICVIAIIWIVCAVSIIGIICVGIICGDRSVAGRRCHLRNRHTNHRH